ncbi:copper amine oxidase N-terminal domain-containing protein [Natronincola ferrireducens]|nr:copper amine oxidase N-terminal domain-containing protein [Natronincola ferrireducens]
MMKSKNILAGFLSMTILSLSVATPSAIALEGVTSIKEIPGMNEVIPISTKVQEIEKLHFGSFTGKVKEITDHQRMADWQFVLVENEEGQIANIIVSQDTYIVNNTGIEVGSIITGYYDANAPMLMIYPPQYNAEVVVIENENEFVKVDIFNEDFVSRDNLLKLNISEDTTILLEDGTVFEGSLANRKLIVFYGASTRSIPAQTTPTKIIVLFEKAVHPIYEEIEEKAGFTINDVSSMDIIVNNNKIEAPAAYTNEEGIVMVPLRAIAEALGFHINWNSQQKTITLDKTISLTVGEDYYTYMKTAPIHLGAAPVVVEGRTFVPLSFFKKVTKMNNAYVFEGQIVIDNGEVME